MTGKATQDNEAPAAKRKAVKRWKKVAFVLLALVLLSQIPFAYRRYRLGRLRADILQLESQRITNQQQNAYMDYRGVIHVHSALGGHSTGSFADIIRAANQNQLAFVVMTEHPSAEFNTALMSLRETHKGVLFINGSEVSTISHDRLLLLPGNELTDAAGARQTQEVITEQKTKNSLAFIAYPQEFQSWNSVSDYNGIEIYNLFTNSRRINPLVTFFDGLWSYWSYPDLLFANFYEKPTASLKLWDEQIRTKNTKLVAIAGNDAHANVGASIGDETGKKFIGIKLDPYERSFRLVRNHILIERDRQLNSENLLAALASGHCYISFDIFCDATGFTYMAANRIETKIMGDEIALEDGVRLNVSAPVKSRIVLIKDGQAIREFTVTPSAEFPVTERGVYRVEVYLDQLGGRLKTSPWIISNPIYVR